jgi:hypothetical protein
MDMRVTKRYAAMLVAAGVAGLAPTLTGCGAPDSKSTGSPASSSTPATAGVPDSIDVNNPAELATALKSVGVDTPPSAPIENERGTLEGLVFPTWPAGEVRKQGLTTYRLDASEGYESDGTLKFMDKNKVLYEVPFKPQLTATVAPIPQVVLESLKTGDTITWGVWFSNKKLKNVTAKFTVIEKQAAAKEIARLTADKSVTPLGRDLAKGQALKNYSLFSEAVVIYANVVKDNPSITTAYSSIMECLRSMKLKNTPLFEDAKSKAIGQSTRQSARFGLGGDVALGTGVGKAPVGAMPVPASDGGGKSGFGPGGAGLKPKDAPAAPTGPDGKPADPAALANQAATHLLAFVSAAKKNADQTAEEAKLAKAKADTDAAAAAKAKTDADALSTKAADDLAKAQDMTNGLSQQERANLMQQALQEQAAAAAAQTAAQALADDAAKSKMFADDAQARADQAAKDAENAPQYMQTADGTIVAFKQAPGSSPTPGKLPDNMLATLKALAEAAHNAQTAAQTRLANAITALNNAVAAKAALEARINDADPTNDPTAAEMNAAQMNLGAAAAEKAAAQQGNIDATMAATEAAAALAAAGG